MTQQIINLGNGPNSQTGDSVFTAFTKANDNFAELYGFLANFSITNFGNITTHDIWSYGNVQVNYGVYANGYYYANGEPVFSRVSVDTSDLRIGNSLILDGGTLTYSNGNFLINGQPLGGISDVVYDSNTGNLSVLSSTGSNFVVDIGVGRSENPTFNSLTVSTDTTVNGNINVGNVNLLGSSIVVDGNTVVYSNAVISANSLPGTGVTPGTYGSANAVPVFTVDGTGRIVEATVAAVAGVSDLLFDPVTGNLTLLTSSGTNFVVNFSNVLANISAISSAFSEDAEASAIANIEANISSLSSLISTEANRAQSIEASLQSQISSLVNVDVLTSQIESNLTTALNSISGNLAAEIARAESAEANISANLSSEATRAQFVEANLQAQINALGNTSALIQSVESSLQSQINSLVNVDAITFSIESNLQSQINTLASQANLAAEVSRATAAEASIAANLASEVSALTGLINAEVSRAQSAESSITSSITTTISTVESNLAIEVSRAQSAESSLATTIGFLTSDVSSEVARAQAVEANLQSQINALGNVDILIQSVEYSLQSQINSLVNVDAITSGIEANLQSQLDAVSGVTDLTYDSITGDLSLTTTKHNYLIDLGVGTSDSPTFAGLTTTSNVNVGGELSVNGSITISGNIVPTEHEVHDLGSIDRAFRDLYLSGNSIYLSGTKLTSSAPGELSLVTNGQTTILNASGNAGIITSNVNALNFISNVTGNVVIDANGFVMDTSLVNTGVNAGHYGTQGTFPSITVDEKGRIVDATQIDILGNASVLGSNTLGQLISNATSLTASTTVTDSIAQLNAILGKLVPPAPPAFPNGTAISISSLSSYRMTNFSQTDNTTTGGKSVSGGSTVSIVRRANTYTTTTVANVGPGDSGTVTAELNGVNAGSTTLSGTSNGTYGNLVILNNQDYHNVVNTVNAGFWTSFSAYASGTVNPGWNEVYLTDTAGGPTNTAVWYYDSSNPGTPTWTNTSVTLTTNVSTYSSTIPHLTSASQFRISGNVNKLSGDMYPATDTFITGAAGGAFTAPPSITYSTAGISTPLARNLYVASGSAHVAANVSVISGFGSSSAGATLTAQNSYNTGANTFNPGAVVLYKTGTGTQIEETSIPVNSVGSGSGNALRVVNPGSADTPHITSNTAFNSQSTTLQTYDATVVAAVLKHDQTNYSTGYYPVGPNLSAGRSGAQYFTFKFTRTAVSKFDVKYTGNIAGMWVALPGSQIDTTSGLNGWVDLGVAYNGSGLPGQNNPGNGSNGCAIGGVASLNTQVTNSSVTATLGTESSSNTATHEIFVRVKLTSGQSVTSISIETATH